MQNSIPRPAQILYKRGQNQIYLGPLNFALDSIRAESLSRYYLPHVLLNMKANNHGLFEGKQCPQ